MALLRMDIPGLCFYGAPSNRDVCVTATSTVQDVFEAVGAVQREAASTPRSFAAVEEHACPGAGACAGQYTANTMSTALEVPRALRLPVPTPSRRRTPTSRWWRRRPDASRCGSWKEGINSRRFVSAPHSENAIASFSADGRLTNAVLHLLAIAAEANVALDIDDFNAICAGPRFLADLRPGGRFVATDLHAAGGLGLLMQRMLELDLLHGR